MLRIRFFKTGKKHQPFFKIVVTDKDNPPQGGNFKAEVGNYDPRSKETELEQDKIEHWLEQGAQPTGRVHNLLVEEGVVEEEKVAVHATKEAEEEIEEEPEQKEQAEEEQGEEAGEEREETEEVEEQDEEEKEEERSREEKE